MPGLLKYLPAHWGHIYECMARIMMFLFGDAATSSWNHNFHIFQKIFTIFDENYADKYYWMTVGQTKCI